MSSDATSSRVTLPPKFTPAQQCTTCGYRWPWVVFNTDSRHQNHHLKDDICVRCQSPELEQWRWQMLRGEMKEASRSQRRQLRKELATITHAPLVKAAIQSTGSEAPVRLPKRFREPLNQIAQPDSLHRPTAAPRDSTTDAAAAILLMQAQHLAATRLPFDAWSKRDPVLVPQSAGSRHQPPTSPPAAPSRPALPPEFQYAIPQNPTAPQLVMPPSLRAVPEPTRAILWLQMHHAPAPPKTTLPQIQIFNSYRAAFPAPTVADPTYTAPQMHGADLIKLIPKCFTSSRLSGRGYVVEGLQLRPFVDPNMAGVLLHNLTAASAQPQPRFVSLSQRSAQQTAPLPLSHRTAGQAVANGYSVVSQTTPPVPSSEPGPSQVKRIRLEAAPFPMLAESQRSPVTSRPVTLSTATTQIPVSQTQLSTRDQAPAPRSAPRESHSSATPRQPSSATSRPQASSSQPLPDPSTRHERSTPQPAQPQPQTPTNSQSTSVSGAAVLSSLRKKLIDLSSRPSTSTSGPRPLGESSKNSTPVAPLPREAKPKSKPIEIISLVDSDDDEPTPPQSSQTPTQTPASARRTGRPTWRTANSVLVPTSSLQPAGSTLVQSPRPEASPSARNSSTHLTSHTASTPNGTAFSKHPTANGGPDSSVPVSVTSHPTAPTMIANGADPPAPRSQPRSQWDSPPPTGPPESTSLAQESLQATELDSEDEVGAELAEGAVEDWWDEIEVETR